MVATTHADRRKNLHWAGRRWSVGRGILLALILTLSGCLGTKFIYNQLDWFITWRLGSFFSLEADQKHQLRETVERNLNWVRIQQMPDYAQLLRELARDIDDDSLTVERIDAHYQTMQVLVDQFLHHVVPDAAKFLAGLSPEQVEILIGNLQKNNKKLWDEYAGSTPEKRRQQREKAIIRIVQRFTGRLDDAQKALVEAHVSRMHDNSREWMEGRERWQQNFRQLLLKSPPADEYAQQLMNMSLDPNRVDADDYRRKVQENQQILMELIAALSASLSDRQRERTVKRLNGLANDLEGLAAQLSGRFVEDRLRLATPGL